MRLYEELSDRYRLLTPPEEYVDDGRAFGEALREVVGPGRLRVLELGAGAGHLASHLVDVELVLTDVSSRMLALAQALIPDARCVLGDMRTLRLGETFDAVIAHDAVCYLRSLEDVRAMAETAWIHLRPGGALIVAPDATAETFEPGTGCGGSDAGDEGVRYLEWTWQRPGQIDGYVVEYVIVHKRGDGLPTVEHDRHEEGLFSRAAWIEALRSAGFEADLVDLGDGYDRFRAVRPAAGP